MRQNRGRSPGLNSGAGSELDIEHLESLVNELAKQKPQEERIKTYMQQAGLEYISDPIERLNMVLRAMEGRPGFLKPSNPGGKTV